MNRRNDDFIHLCIFLFLMGYSALAATLLLRGNDQENIDAVPNTTGIVARSVVLELPSKENNPRNSEGDFIRLRTGEILYVYTHYEGGTGTNKNVTTRLMSRVSKDQGRTWSTQDKLVLGDKEIINAASVSLLRLRDQSIALFYSVKDSAGDCRPYLRYSYDEGKTWTRQIETIVPPSYNVLNNSRATLLADGRILLPVARHAYLGGDLFNYESKGVLFCLISDDGGRKWSQSSEVPNPNSLLCQEPGIVELADGKLLMTIRTDQGRQYYSYSLDRGESWSLVKQSPLTSPQAPATIKRLPDSDYLVAVWDDSPYERNPLTIGILSPDGSKILSKKILDRSGDEEIRSFCYPAIFFVDSSALLTAYCSGRTSMGLDSSRITLVGMQSLLEDVSKLMSNPTL